MSRNDCPCATDDTASSTNKQILNFIFCIVFYRFSYYLLLAAKLTILRLIHLSIRNARLFICNTTAGRQKKRCPNIVLPTFGQRYNANRKILLRRDGRHFSAADFLQTPRRLSMR